MRKNHDYFYPIGDKRRNSLAFDKFFPRPRNKKVTNFKVHLFYILSW